MMINCLADQPSVAVKMTEDIGFSSDVLLCFDLVANTKPSTSEFRLVRSGRADMFMSAKL